MNKSGPIIVIQDDADDQLTLQHVFRDLQAKNEVLFFSSGEVALAYLEKTLVQPFLILSDIDLPKLNGLELRDKVHNNEQLRLKCIPYLFFTTTANHRMVIDAYSKSVQGFFVKPSSHDQLTRVMHNIIEYWKECHSPNKVAE